MKQPNAPGQPALPKGVILREHVYDGIQEYDQRLPNWWLWTFYGAIIFSVIYWLSWYQSTVMTPDEVRIANEMSRIEAKRLEQAGQLDDATLWKMSANPQFVTNGKGIYEANCVACHLASLRGKAESPSAAGESLVDAKWLYGGNPTDLYRVIYDGSPNKASGMQAWGAQLGPQRVAQVLSFVLSHHSPPAPVPAPAP